MTVVQSPMIPIVGQLIRDNPGTISLGQGIVSYPPPPTAIEGISEFLKKPDNHQYKAVQGISPLLDKIASKLAAENGIEINAQKAIVVTAGSNMAFMNAVLAITQAGDEIILNTPYYFNHEMAIRMADCRPVLVPTDDEYQLQFEAIARAINDRTRAVVTISPNNPTGVIYSESILREVNQLCQQKGIYHITDETYEYFANDEIKHFSPGSILGSENNTISLFSLSKAYGFASWRIGYMVIPKSLLVDIEKIQDTILICPPVISQYAAIGALQAGINYCQPYLQEITKVRATVLKSLKALENLGRVVPAEGAFYFFLKVHTSINDFELVKTLIENYKIAALPGTTFGMTEGCYLRIAYGALQKETVAEGIERLIQGLKKIV